MNSPEPSSRLTPQQAVEVIQLARTQGFIPAIKRYREITGVGLAEAKTAVEALPGVGTNPVLAPAASAPEQDAELQAYLHQGDPQKISAIKRYRELTGVGLAEAKQAVEALLAAQPGSSAPGAGIRPPIFSSPAGRGLAPELEAELVALLRQGAKVPAIKRYREAFPGADLAEAKSAVEALAHKHGIAAPVAKPCFVATAVFADAEAPAVRLLRHWRDRRLVLNPAGRCFIRLYSVVGPSLAWMPRHSRLCQSLLRRLLSAFAHFIARRQLLVLGFALLGAWGSHCPAAEAGRARPNVLFFLADDLGYMDIGANNPKTFYDTPNLNRLAKQGMRFTSGYAACPVCSPTRASILTGKYPQRTGITDFIGAAQPEKWPRPTKLLPAPYQDRLALEETTLAEAFKAQGYATFFAGKWHLGPTNYWPENQGFDINMGGIDRGGPYGGKKYFSPYGNPRLPDGPPGEHLPDRLATETVKFIEANRDRPFLAYFSFYSVHTPLMAREDLQKKYEAKAKTLPTNGPAWGQERERKVRLVQNHAVYAGMVEALDQAVGKVLTALERTGLQERTIIVFMSDNGGLSTSEGHPTSNLPLRAGKGWLYEGGIREPWIVCAPGVTQPGSVCDTPVTSTDFFPTLLELAGLPLQPALHRDGVSLVPLLKGRELARGPLFWHYPHYGNQGGAPGGAVRDGDWKLIEWYEDGALELFNLRDDLGETNNLAAQEPGRASALHAKLKAWRVEVGAKMPSPNPKSPPATGTRPKAAQSNQL